MFDELFEPLTKEELACYLKRLEISKAEKPTLSFLDQLIFAHQTHIVFEDLDAWLYHQSAGLGTKALYEKIILNGRGGYCFELNALFHHLLIALGYEATACMCRILEDSMAERNQISHRAEIVTLEGRSYFCDVGFGGPMPAGALELIENSWQIHKGQSFCIQSHDQNWKTLRRKTAKGETEDILQFTLMAQSPVDFVPLHEYFSKDPSSDFVRYPYLNIRTKDGSKSIAGNIFSIHEKGSHQKQILQSEEELFSVIHSHFHLT